MLLSKVTQCPWAETSALNVYTIYIYVIHIDRHIISIHAYCMCMVIQPPGKSRLPSRQTAVEETAQTNFCFSNQPLQNIPNSEQLNRAKWSGHAELWFQHGCCCVSSYLPIPAQYTYKAGLIISASASMRSCCRPGALCKCPREALSHKGCQTQVALLGALGGYNSFPESFRKRPSGVCAVNFGPQKPGCAVNFGRGKPVITIHQNRVTIDRPTPAAQIARVASAADLKTSFQNRQEA